MCHHEESEEWEAIRGRLRERHEEELGDEEGEVESPEEREESDEPDSPVPPTAD